MINPEVIQQTETRFGERQPIRQAREAKIRAGAILEADTPERVRKRIESVARMAIETEGVGLPAPGQAAGPAALALERIIARNDLLSIRYVELAARVARTVARVHVRELGGSLAGYGTGFLVSPRLLLTNNHVFGNAAQAGASRVEFDFQEGYDGKLRSSLFFELDPAAFFVTDKALDFTLVALKGSLSKLEAFGWNALSAAEGKVIAGEYVSIIQHPSGERKQIAVRENQVVDVLDNFLHYRTDTAPGSSGSPVFNDQWEVVALHHSGVPKKNAAGQFLTKDGKVWTQGMPDNLIQWIANEGIRIGRILKHVQGLTLSGSQAALRKQLLDSDRGWRPGSASAGEQWAIGAEESGRGETTWRLPLQLTIEVGQTPSGIQVSAGGGPRAEANAQHEPTDGGESAAPPQAELVSAWQAYESAGRAPGQAPPESTPPAQVPPGPPASGQSPLEWLTAAASAPLSGQALPDDKSPFE